MVQLDRETSNALFKVLEDWNRILKYGYSPLGKGDAALSRFIPLADNAPF